MKAQHPRTARQGDHYSWFVLLAPERSQRAERAQSGCAPIEMRQEQGALDVRLKASSVPKPGRGSGGPKDWRYIWRTGCCSRGIASVIKVSKRKYNVAAMQQIVFHKRIENTKVLRSRKCSGIYALRFVCVDEARTNTRAR